MTSLVVIGRPLLVEGKAQVRQQFVDCRLVLEMKKGFALPPADTRLARNLRRRIEIEVGHHRGEMSNVISCGPETAEMT
jgi:hypothetical protein